MPNRLADETSPYLLQHAHNPVDWRPWGEEAIEASRQQDKPIFLSIGYSACHWCHVMERESFENDQIAAELNELFINIKVDREERPDLDQIYMNAVQMMTGRGGWPMSMFLTSQLEPFFGGTYWPPERRMGMPGFVEVIRAVDDAWRNRREQALEQAGEITKRLRTIGAGPSTKGQSDDTLSEGLLTAALTKLERAFDFTNGGFGTAPKFPHAMDVQLLLRVWRRTDRDGALQMARLTLDKMAAGGIYDHLAGGFARYSVDERWLVPHFEKMLYDNALLTMAYLDGFLATGEPRYRRVVEETLDYILRYMTDDGGGFHSTEDADSEGVEGKFYVWSPGEIAEVLGADRAEQFCYVYDVDEQGNFEGQSILNLPKSIEQCASLKNWDLDRLTAELAEDREKLLAVRDQRIRPGKDDKILASWNGLMIDALARSAAALDRADYLAAAQRAAKFVLHNMRRDDGRLLHGYRHGRARFDAYLEDYSFLANSLISLYEADFDETWIDEAVRLADEMLERFEDAQQGGFYFTADDHERLIARNKDLHDSSTPSGNAMAATCLARLARLTGRTDYDEAVRRTLRGAREVMEQSPSAAGQMLIALDLLLGPTAEIIVLGDHQSGPTRDALRTLRAAYLPNRVVACRGPATAHRSPQLEDAFKGKAPAADSPTVFLCRDFACQEPRSGDDAMTRVLAEL